MKRLIFPFFLALFLIVAISLFFTPGIFAAENACVACHSEADVTPLQVKDWQQSKHSSNDITCDVCHGDGHEGYYDVDNVKLPSAEICAACHSERFEQYKKGKHALAYASMNAMPATHYQPMELIQGDKGCGGCHKIGFKTSEQILKLKDEGFAYGVASCDACHTRHTFSVKEAREPEACATCHMGFDHPQWEMWSNSKHGVRYQLKRLGILPEDAAAPKCQTCHMDEGNHEVRAAWGFLAVRLPLPEDEQWKEDRVSILKALGVLDPDGNPTKRLDAVKAADVARLDQESWEVERRKMVRICSKCHSTHFALGELKKGDDMIRQADRLMAEAIEIVVSLYRDDILFNSMSYPYEYPDLLYFHEATTPIEQRLYKMFMKHRMRTFQGAFHANPDYTFWYGWAEMKTDLVEIRHMAEQLRKQKK